jgi:hypothetical protein
MYIANTSLDVVFLTLPLFVPIVAAHRSRIGSGHLVRCFLGSLFVSAATTFTAGPARGRRRHGGFALMLSSQMKQLGALSRPSAHSGPNAALGQVVHVDPSQTAAAAASRR